MYGKQAFTTRNQRMSEQSRRLLFQDAIEGRKTVSQLNASLELPIRKRDVQKALSTGMYPEYAKMETEPTLTESD